MVKPDYAHPIRAFTTTNLKAGLQKDVRRDVFKPFVRLLMVVQGDLLGPFGVMDCYEGPLQRILFHIYLCQ